MVCKDILLMMMYCHFNFFIGWGQNVPTPLFIGDCVDVRPPCVDVRPPYGDAKPTHLSHRDCVDVRPLLWRGVWGRKRLHRGMGAQAPPF